LVYESATFCGRVELFEQTKQKFGVLGAGFISGAFM
jgi:hypothetical protein